MITIVNYRDILFECTDTSLEYDEAQSQFNLALNRAKNGYNKHIYNLIGDSLNKAYHENSTDLKQDAKEVQVLNERYKNSAGPQRTSITAAQRRLSKCVAKDLYVLINKATSKFIDLEPKLLTASKVATVYYIEKRNPEDLIDELIEKAYRDRVRQHLSYNTFLEDYLEGIVERDLTNADYSWNRGQVFLELMTDLGQNKLQEEWLKQFSLKHYVENTQSYLDFIIKNIANDDNNFKLMGEGKVYYLNN